MAESATKRCTRCSEIKPPDEFARDAGRPDGLFSWCRECQREHGAARRAARQVATEGEKPCTKCGETKPVTEFSPGGAQYGRKSWCRACCSEANRARYQARDDAARRAANESSRRWKAAHPDIVRAHRRAYRAERREIVTAWQRDYQARLRAQVLEHYGTVCACCGTTAD